MNNDIRCAMAQAGLYPHGELIADGTLHRFKSGDDKKPDSWYVLHQGPPMAAGYGDWKKQIKEKWCDRSKKYSDAEWRAIREQWAKADELRKQAEQEARAKAVVIAEWIIKRAEPVSPQHPYLVTKQIGPHGARCHKGAITLPLRDADGKLMTLHFTSRDGVKLYLKNGQASGAFYRLIGDANGPLIICEGFATAASINEATGFEVVAAMNCGNLMPVATALRLKYPERSIIIAADNDFWTEGNPGLTKATEAAKAIRAKVVYPEFKDTSEEPTDFNDLAVLVGSDEVKRQLEREANQPEPKPTLLDDLEKRFGEGVFHNKDGSLAGVNESFFAGLHAAENVMLYEPDEKIFYNYSESTGLYAEETPASVMQSISDRMLRYADENNEPGLVRKRSANGLANIVKQLQGISERRGIFAERRKIIHLSNGVIQFDPRGNVQLLPFSPSYYSRNRSPIAYDKSAKCYRFINELLAPAVSKDDLLLLQVFAGMFLLGYNRAQRMLILDGLAGRGKSVLAIVYQLLVGLQNVTQLRTQHLAERFEIFRFLKKTLLVGVDVAPDFLSTKGAGVLKGLVGNDWFDAEQKGGTGCFPVQGKFNVVITSNARLRVRLQGDVGAWKRRLCKVPFEAPPPTKKISDFGSELIRTEGSGILNWALDGARMLLEQMPDEGGDLQLTSRQANVVESLLAESESLRHFLIDAVIRDDISDLTTNEIIEGYSAYCPDQGWQPLAVTEIQSTLEGLMLELFGVSKSHSIKRDNRSQRGFYRVRFKESSENLPLGTLGTPFSNSLASYREG